MINISSFIEIGLLPHIIEESYDICALFQHHRSVRDSIKQHDQRLLLRKILEQELFPMNIADISDSISGAEINIIRESPILFPETRLIFVEIFFCLDLPSMILRRDHSDFFQIREDHSWARRIDRIDELLS